MKYTLKVFSQLTYERVYQRPLTEREWRLLHDFLWLGCDHQDVRLDRLLTHDGRLVLVERADGVQ